MGDYNAGRLKNVHTKFQTNRSGRVCQSSSGDQITSFNHFSGISMANGRVYIATYDGNVYCFGIKQ
jgi:hypothetical protein